MTQPRSLLPAHDGRSAYESLQSDAHIWLPAMQAICQRHALPADALVRLSEGTNVVFAAGAVFIVKLYPPYGQRFFIADRLIGEHLYGKLGVATQEIIAAGEIQAGPI